MKLIDFVSKICYNKVTVVVFTAFVYYEQAKTIYSIRKKRENLWLKF